MKSTVRLTAIVVMFALCLGSALAQPISKKKKILVNVQLDGCCSEGSSLTGDMLGKRELCVEKPGVWLLSVSLRQN